MGSFGWAYVNCTGSSGGVGGPLKSVQFLKTASTATGSSQFVYHQDAYGSYGPSTLTLTGTLVVSGAISASHYQIEDVTRIDVSGSSWMGNTNDDIHARTGSLVVENEAGNAILTTNAYSKQVFANTLAMRYDRITTDLVTSSATVGIYSVAGPPASLDIRVHSASVAGQGAICIFKDELTAIGRGGGKITLYASSGDTIDAGATYQLAGDRPAVNLFSDGANWWVF